MRHKRQRLCMVSCFFGRKPPYYFKKRSANSHWRLRRLPVKKHLRGSCSSHAHHMLITCSSHAHHMLITCSSHPHHILITSSSHPHHILITSSSHPHHILITSSSHPHHILINAVFNLSKMFPFFLGLNILICS